MKRVLTALLAVFTCASIASAYTFSYQPDSTWVSNSYESAPNPTAADWWTWWADGKGGGYHDNAFPPDFTNAQGVGQYFDVTNHIGVKEIRIALGRWYTTNDLYLTIYKNVDNTVAPSNYMTASNIVAQFTLDPSNTVLHASSGDAPGDVLTIFLETNEYFSVDPLGTNTDNICYYFHIDFEDVDFGTNEFWKAALWNSRDDYDPNGFYRTPGGEFTSAAGRDVGFALVGTNPPVVVLPEIPTNWILPVADTSVRHYESGKTGSNYGNALDLATRNYYSGGDPTVAGNHRDYNAYVRFDLTAYAGATITNATFGITRANGGSLVNGRVRFLGLDNVVSNTPQDWGELTLTGDSVGAEHIDYTTSSNAPTDGFVSNRVTDFEAGLSNIVETVSGEDASITGGALVDWLNARLADADTNGNIYATLIVDFPQIGGNQSIGYFSRENVGSLDQDKVPHLIIDYIPGGPVGPQFDPTINSISVVGGTVTIGWDSDSNGTYRVESQSALSGTNWTPVAGATNLTGGTGNSTPVTASGASEEFFRIQGE